MSSKATSEKVSTYDQVGQIANALPWIFGTDITLLALVLAAGILLIGGFLKGTVGFAVGLVTVAGLVQVFPPKLVVVALSIPFLLSNVIVLVEDGVPYGFIRGQYPFVLALAVGLVGGVLLLRIVSERFLFLFLAGYIGLFLLVQWYERRIYEIADHGLAGLMAGSISGVIGGAVSAPGPPLVIHAYLNTLGDGKTAFVTATSSLFLIAHCFRLTFLANVGLLGVREILLGLAFSVPIYIGVALGIRARPYLDSRKFTMAIKVLLVLIGLRLLARGLGVF